MTTDALTDQLFSNFQATLFELQLIEDEEYKKEKINLNSLNCSLHRLSILWGSCAEYLFKLILLNEGDNIYSSSKTSNVETISTKEALKKIYNNKIINIEMENYQQLLNLIQKRNQATHLPNPPGNNLTEYLYDLINGISILDELADSTLQIQLIDHDDKSEYFGNGIYLKLRREIELNSKNPSFLARMYKGKGGRSKPCNNCQGGYILIPQNDNSTNCIKCSQTYFFSTCLIPECQSSFWANYNLPVCPEHILELIQEKMSNENFNLLKLHLDK